MHVASDLIVRLRCMLHDQQSDLLFVEVELLEVEALLGHVFDMRFGPTAVVIRRAKARAANIRDWKID
jgi:hypothetical protein